MEKLKLILVVAEHGCQKRMRNALEQAGCVVCFCLSGQGTAKAAWLEYLGLSDTRKDVILAPCPHSRASNALSVLDHSLQGTRYFAATIPLSSIAGRETYQMLSEGGAVHGQRV